MYEILRNCKYLKKVYENSNHKYKIVDSKTSMHRTSLQNRRKKKEKEKQRNKNTDQSRFQVVQEQRAVLISDGGPGGGVGEVRGGGRAVLIGSQRGQQRARRARRPQPHRAVAWRREQPPRRAGEGPDRVCVVA